MEMTQIPFVSPCLLKLHTSPKTKVNNFYFGIEFRLWLQEQGSQ